MCIWWLLDKQIPAHQVQNFSAHCRELLWFSVLIMHHFCREVMMFFFLSPFQKHSCKFFYNASFHISNNTFCIEAALLVHYLKLGFLCSSKFHCKLACNVLSYNSRNFLLAPLYRLTADTCSYRITGNGHAPVHVAPRLVHYAHGKYCKHGKCASYQSRVCYTQQGKRKRIHATRRQKTFTV